MHKGIMLVAGVVGVWAIAAMAISQEANRDVSFKTQIEKLEKQLASLEKRIADLEKRPSVVAVPQPVPATSSRAVPESWSAREFNGQTYYIVPLEQTGSGPAVRSR